MRDNIWERHTDEPRWYLIHATEASCAPSTFTHLVSPSTFPHLSFLTSVAVAAVPSSAFSSSSYQSHVAAAGDPDICWLRAFACSDWTTPFNAIRRLMSDIKDVVDVSAWVLRGSRTLYTIITGKEAKYRMLAIDAKVVKASAGDSLVKMLPRSGLIHVRHSLPHHFQQIPCRCGGSVPLEQLDRCSCTHCVCTRHPV